MSVYKYDRKISGHPSTVIKQAWYDEKYSLLFIEINNKIYGYHNVTSYTWDEFAAAKSLGTFYSARIKGSYAVISDNNIELVAREDENPELDFVVTLEGTWKVSVKARTVEEARDKLLEGAPDGVVVKEVSCKF